MKPKSNKKFISGISFNAAFLSASEKNELLSVVSNLNPLWEMRYSKHCPPPEGDTQRPLLRPVYWYGNWQFACLGYYSPPEGIQNSAITAEEFPPLIRNLALRLESVAKRIFKGKDIPENFEFNTCLINYYGDLKIDNKWVDQARVGDHKDFEPGPVGSLSLGERALFQFVKGKSKNANNVAHELWLTSGSGLVFGGEIWKEIYFHRVQRVENKNKLDILKRPLSPDFKTRRVNLTFRFVPREHWTKIEDLPKDLNEDIYPYLKELSKSSSFFREKI